MASVERGISQDERAVTVIFGTLMIILITIIATSTFAFFVSLAQKDSMDLQILIDAAKNENLKIVTIHSIQGDMDSDYWSGLDITVYNSDINDAGVNAISLNDKFMLERFLEDNKGNLILDN